MRLTLTVLISIAIPFYITAQTPSQAEIDKMMKQAQDLMKKYGGDSTMKNETKNQQGNNPGITNASYNSDPGSYGNVDNWKFPPKNPALLASITQKKFTRSDVVSFLNDLYLQLSKKLQPTIHSSVQSIAAKFSNDGNKMSDAAVTAWYSNYHEESLLLIVKAAAVNPDNGILLNNCAAILNMGGIEQKAIPILKYLLNAYPPDAMVLNNLGQAYAGLGETDSAMFYFGRCLKIEPQHAEACGTAGFIEESKGHTEKAIEYFEKSIKTAYSKAVALKLKKLKKGSRIRPLIRPRIKLPDYFNQFKYDFPPQCISTSNAVMAEAEHNAFRKMISQQAQKYGTMYAELAQKQMQKGMEIMKANGVGRILKSGEFIAQPFYEQCQIMAGEVLSDYRKELTEFNSKTLKVFTSDMAAIENEYKKQYNAMMGAFALRCPSGEGASHANCATEEEICTAKNALANTYLPKFAYLTQEVQEKGKLIFNTYFDELVYWHYLSIHPVSSNDFRMQHYYFIEQYLTMMGGLCQTKIIKPCNDKTVTTTKESNSIKEIECPMEISIPFIVGKFELDCEKISFSGGEGAVFSYEKNFKSRKSTLSVGIGAKLEIGKISAGPAEASVSAGVSETLFITFDGDDKVSDFGLKFGAKISAGAEVTGKKEVTSEKAIEVKKDMGSKEVGVGYKFGINSGWDFNEGPFKGLIGPAPEQQLNKNVNIYKPG